jgi:signal transduction histidine kinase
MMARVRRFGGKLDIRSGPMGTTVHAAVPVEQPCPLLHGSPAIRELG